MIAKRTNLKLLLCGAISVFVLQALYLAWPKSVSFDVSYSLFLAQNIAEYGRFETLEPTSMGPDLGQIKMQWLTTWPPLVAMCFALLLKLGITVGASVSIMSLAALLLGTWGWTLLVRKAQAPLLATYVLAAAIPWLWFPSFAMVSFYNDHMLWALTPWAFLLLLNIPSTGKVEAHDLFFRIPATAFISGLLVAVKFSAFPLVLGAGVFFMLRDGINLSVRKLLHTVFFAIFASLPGLVVIILNHALSGETSGVLTRAGFHFVPIGWEQIWNLLIPPAAVVFDWSRIAFHLGGGYWLELLSATLTGVLILILTISSYVKWRESPQLRIFPLLMITTTLVWAFLLGMTMLVGKYFDWTSEPRYYIPVYFAWLLIGIALIFEPSVKKWMRGALLLLIGVPVLVSAGAAVVKPLLRDAPELLPRSKLAAINAGEAEVYHFVAQYMSAHQHRPALLITPLPHAMNELGIPTIAWLYAGGYKSVYSSTPIEVWALLDADSAAKLLTTADNRANVNYIQLPEGLKWQFMILTFP